MRPSLTLLLLPLIQPASSSSSKPKSGSKPKDAILLSTVQTLTLHANKPTTHARVPPIPQLRCVSSPALCALHKISIMRCTNQGSSYGAEEIEWSCTTPLPPELRLGATDVVCEGYTGPDDPYVLRGSCGVEYRLALTEAGERRFPEIANAGGEGGGWFSGWGGTGGGRGGGKDEETLRYPDDDFEKKDEGSDISAWLFGVIFVGVFLWILYSAWMQTDAQPGGARRPRNPPYGGGGGFDPGFGPGGGGGGGGGYGPFGDDPPPPYSKYSGSSGQTQGGWRPGFWSGMAGGAAAAYLAGNRGNRQQGLRDSYRGGGGGGSSSGDWDSRPGPSSSSGGSNHGMASTSSSRYTSTGFGSTSRR